MSSHPHSLELPAGVVVFERGWLSSNNILLVGRTSAALVDSGYATHTEQTLALVQSALAGRELDTLVNTHLHSDHCGGNARLQQAYPSLQTLIPPGQADEVRRWDPVSLTYVPTGQQCARFRFDATLLPGSELVLGDARWEVHAAPGHDPHSVVLFERHSRVLISADALWKRGFGVVFPELEGSDGFEEVAATLHLIESLQPSIVIPGHGGVFADVLPALRVARSKLDAFVRDPAKHARHAAKVLVKFKLLELQKVQEEDLLTWASGTAYLSRVAATWFPDVSTREWLRAVIEELVSSGAGAREGSTLINT
jgi:glyoxylase-like metal-dependent hydrolase (beta-lactamase superfamily II)